MNVVLLWRKQPLRRVKQISTGLELKFWLVPNVFQAFRAFDCGSKTVTGLLKQVPEPPPVVNLGAAY